MSGRDAIEKLRDLQKEFFCVMNRSNSVAHVTLFAQPRALANIFDIFLYLNVCSTKHRRVTHHGGVGG